MFNTLPKTAQEFMNLKWAQIEPYYADLEARAGCSQNQSALEPAADSGAAGHCRKVP